jgi:hypothetical protein
MTSRCGPPAVSRTRPGHPGSAPENAGDRDGRPVRVRGLLLAGAVIAMIACIIVYVALQRFYMRGLMSGALKG